MSDRCLFQHLKLQGFLSFGPDGVDLALEPLNVLIGANGSGKSNTLEAFSLLRTAVRDLPRAFARWRRSVGVALEGLRRLGPRHGGGDRGDDRGRSLPSPSPRLRGRRPEPPRD